MFGNIREASGCTAWQDGPTINPGKHFLDGAGWASSFGDTAVERFHPGRCYKVVDPAAGSRRRACKAGANVHGGCRAGGRGDSGSDLSPAGPSLHVLHAPLDGLGMFEVR